MQVPTVFLPALFAALSAAQGVQFNYPCRDCGCQSATEAHFSNGDVNIGRCLSLGGFFQSVGLSGGSSFHCTMWTGDGCTGAAQNVGINNKQTFGCTNEQNGYFRSAQCWTQN